jgi:hypothetical protein
MGGLLIIGGCLWALAIAHTKNITHVGTIVLALLSLAFLLAGLRTPFVGVVATSSFALTVNRWTGVRRLTIFEIASVSAEVRYYTSDSGFFWNAVTPKITLKSGRSLWLTSYSDMWSRGAGGSAEETARQLQATIGIALPEQ